ncbi:hypothetical protein P153DRAFT_368132 [Dothidotthia symphoricarpi CBS 119687]|uniref:Uncharacterized protein n=1 Tax=Dothidotthia symphoricarpi CBS 119687 TaxID=1392245 RepID=A0A6A6A8G7_9PLEO|nr:uncharacterized protein P153DRAFT_368132 [Dothidotthia symphoricarpi CBS 119687]KAF2127495.1 hypothetical protein P153DRAFT_368132 [Dothidotthia symphoricarpi CBS 119687]
MTASIDSIEESSDPDRSLHSIDSDDDVFHGRAGPVLLNKTSEGAKASTDAVSHSLIASELGEEDHISQQALESPTRHPSPDPNTSPGLFRSEDEDSSLVLKRNIKLKYTHSTSSLPNMSGPKRARNTKTKVDDNDAISPQVPKHNSNRHLEEDPEAQTIKTLRDDQHMKFHDIVSHLNQARLARGEAATWTEPAVYSRLVRSTPRLATATHEIGFDPKDYMHLRHPNLYTDDNGTGTTSKAGKKRVKNYDNAMELRVNLRAKLDDQAELETAEKSEQLLLAVAKVERNFWVLVADEMERATTKLYAPEVLRGRYRDI